MAPGDRIVFAGQKRLFAESTVVRTFRSESLSRALWAAPANNEQSSTTWELMFELRDTKPLNVPYEAMNHVIGRIPQAMVMGFSVLNESQSDNLIALLDGSEFPRDRDEPVRQAGMRARVEFDKPRLKDRVQSGGTRMTHHGELHADVEGLLPWVEIDDVDELTDQEQADLAEAESDAEPVSYTGTDFDVEGLVRRLHRGDIVIPTFGHEGAEDIETARFQRGFVWSRPQMDRFIESLLLGYPIPGIILVQQADKRYLVLDGQQRLRTLSALYKGVHHDRVFALQNVSDRFRGLTYENLDDTFRRTLDNTFLQATIVKTDGSLSSLDAVYQVFERLNSGGTQLTPHEIRIALYAGALVDFLAELNAFESWRQLYGPLSPRLRDQELVLRAMALFLDSANYKRPLKQFLNDFMAKHRDATDVSLNRAGTRFRLAVDLLAAGPGRDAFRRTGGAQVNVAKAEAMLVGLMRRLDRSPEPTVEQVSEAVSSLSANRNLEDAISKATADEDSVRTRLSVSTERFDAV